jgi:hypothetical protein
MAMQFYLGLFGLAVRVGAVVLVIAWLWIGLWRAGLARGARRTGIATTCCLLAWCAGAWLLALSGFFASHVALALPLCWGVCLIWMIPLLRSRSIGAALDNIPPWWLVALQSYRFLAGVIWFGQLAAGRLPAEYAVRAGVTDGLVGLLAVVVAIWVYRGAPGWRVAAIAWNVFGLFDFAVGLDEAAMGLLSGAGFVGTFVPYALAYPVVMIPAFMAPLSTDLHVLSLRQLARSIKREGHPATPVSARAA